MISPNIDLGQAVIAILIGTIGWFVKTAITRLYETVDRHDKQISDIMSRVEGLVSRFENRNGARPEREEYWK